MDLTTLLLMKKGNSGSGSGNSPAVVNELNNVVTALGSSARATNIIEGIRNIASALAGSSTSSVDQVDGSSSGSGGGSSDNSVLIVEIEGYDSEKHDALIKEKTLNYEWPGIIVSIANITGSELKQAIDDNKIIILMSTKTDDIGKTAASPIISSISYESIVDTDDTMYNIQILNISKSLNRRYEIYDTFYSVDPSGILICKQDLE